MTVSSMLTPTPAAQTVTVQVAGTNLTVKVTVVQNTATVSSTSTMPWNGNPGWHPSTWTTNPWTPATTAATTTSLARGDLALIAGFRSHNLLHAQIVLFTPMTSSMVGGTGTSCPTTGTGTGTGSTGTGTGTGTGSTTGSSGTHT
jgi:hypothetical protein